LGIIDMTHLDYEKLREAQELPLELIEDARLILDDDYIEVSGKFKSMQQVISVIDKDTLEICPNIVQLKVHQFIEQYLNVFMQITTLKPQDQRQRPSPKETSLIALKKLFEDFSNSIIYLIPYIKIEKYDLEATSTQADEILSRIIKTEESVYNQSSEYYKEMERKMHSMEDAVARIGITSEAKYFNLEANNCLDISSKWLKASIALGIITLITLFVFFSIHYCPLYRFDYYNTFQMFSFITSKVLIIGILIYATTTSIRNFMAYQHNATVNRHRQNALLTYKALVEGATDETIKDTVLNHAAHCIYSHQETGFTKPNTQQSDSSLIAALIPRLSSSMNNPSS
jgi:hypothetical protein